MKDRELPSDIFDALKDVFLKNGKVKRGNIMNITSVGRKGPAKIIFAAEQDKGEIGRKTVSIALYSIKTIKNVS